MTLYKQLTEQQIEKIDEKYKDFKHSKQEILDELNCLTSFNNLKLSVACKIYWVFYDEPFDLDKFINLWNSNEN